MEDGRLAVNSFPQQKKNSNRDASTAGGAKKQRMRRFSRFTTGEGKEYYVPEDGGQSVWTLPAGAEVVHL